MVIHKLFQQFDKHAELIALEDEDNRLTYHQLKDAIVTTARELYQYDIKQGDMVAVHMDNQIECVIAQLSLLALGASIISLPPTYQEHEFRHAFTLTQCDVLITNKRLLSEKKTLIKGISKVFELTLNNRVITLKQLTKQPSNNAPFALNDIPYDKNQIAVIFFTSGSTGVPKGICHRFNALSECMAYYAQYGFRYATDDKVLVSLTLCHAFAFCVQTLPTLFAGGCCYLLRDNSAKNILDAITQKHITTVGLLPQGLIELINYADNQQHQHHALRLVTAGGNAVPEWTFARFKAIFNIDVYEVWGMSETMLCFINDSSKPNKIGSVGRCLPIFETKLVGKDGKSPSSEGELCIYSSMNHIGYYHDNIKQDSQHTEWVKTGDIFSCDNDGFFWFKGRCKQLIITDGHNVSPNEVEASLNRYCQLKEVCVFGIDDGNGNEIVAVTIVSDSQNTGPLLQSIKDKLSNKMALYKIPRKLFTLTSFPKNSIGKIDRHKIKALSLNQLNRNA